MSMKNSSDTIGNRTRDLPACSTMLQPTAPPCAPPPNLYVFIRVPPKIYTYLSGCPQNLYYLSGCPQIYTYLSGCPPNLHVFIPWFLAELLTMLCGTQGFRWTLAGKLVNSGLRHLPDSTVAVLSWGATTRHLDVGQSWRMNEAFVTEWRKKEKKGSWCMNRLGDEKNDSYWIKEI